jgi:hypothetical protein
VRNKIISSVGVAVGVTVVLIVNRFQPMVPSAAVGFGSGVVVWVILLFWLGDKGTKS